MSTVRTVSDTKRTFYSLHTRPINSLFRRVVEELMVEMHLLSVNVDFRYDPIFALGVVTAFDRFMQGYRPAGDKDLIFSALSQSLSSDAHQYRSQSQRLLECIGGMSSETLMNWFNQTHIPPHVDDVQQQIYSIIANPKFKYSRLFAIGLYTLLEAVNPEGIKDPEQLKTLLTSLASAFKVPVEYVEKDLELYRSNLDKMEQAQAVMEDILQAERKKRELQAQAAASSEPSSDASQAEDQSALDSTNT